MRYVELRRHTDNDGDRLTEQGIADAEALGRDALNPPYSSFVSSGAARATEVITIFRRSTDQTEVPITLEDGLRSAVEDRWREASKTAGTGASVEDMRAVDADLVEQEARLLSTTDPPVPPHMRVWRSVRAGGDTKTRTSRRTLALPERCVEALREQQERQGTQRPLATSRGRDTDLVFASEAGTTLDAANVRRGFRRIATAAGLNAADWTPRELRHSFVSLLSDKGVPIEQIARLVGHTGGSAVTETVYRKQLRPVINDGAVAMNELFPRAGSYSVGYSPRPTRSKTPGPELR